LTHVNARIFLLSYYINRFHRITRIDPMSYKNPVGQVVHLIDDDFAVRDSTKLLLQTMGIDIRAYRSGEEFLNDANPDEARCLVVDVDMPGINGIDLLDRLRKGEITAPAIFITAHGNTADLRAAAARTGASVLLKPFKPGELIARIENALDENRAASASARRAGRM
jgi:two-component system, LuxR family, response regulator FixJ